MMYQELLDKQRKLAVVGLGYVGLPIALEFARHFSVVGFDISESRLAQMREGIDPSKELPGSAFEGRDILFTSSLEDLRGASFYVVAVPTPIDQFNNPDLTPLLKACISVGQCLKPGDYVCFESTVYPGCTEEDCIPVLERESRLRAGIDFKVGYSPERINPGDTKHTLSNTVKIVSGCDAEALECVARVYETVVAVGVHRAPTIKVAEAAKIIENTQRDVNIALMNELSIIFGRMGVNTYDVLEAAATKWNFLAYSPGLVGGHCIGVDPYYMVHKAIQLKFHPRIISSGRAINDSMGGYIAKKLVKCLIAMGKAVLGARVLVKGFTFKEDVSDVRNTKVIDIVRELEDYGVHVEVMDPHAGADEVRREYNISLRKAPEGQYDAIVVAVPHRQYLDYDEAYFQSLSRGVGLLVDVKGLYRGKISEMHYWSL